MPAGRPSDYDYNLCVEICEKVADGKNIKVVLSEKEEYPTFPTWCRWKRENDELFNLYTKSIQDKAESVDFEIDQLIDEVKQGLIEPAQARIIIDTLKWKAAKYYPRMFGDKAGLLDDSKVEVTLKTPDFLFNSNPLANDKGDDEPTQD